MKVCLSISSSGLTGKYVLMRLSYFTYESIFKLLQVIAFHFCGLGFLSMSEHFVDFIYLLIWSFTPLATLYPSYIMTGSFVNRGNHYIQLTNVLYCKLPTIGKQLPTFLNKVWGLNHRPQGWEASVLPLPTEQSVKQRQII